MPDACPTCSLPLVGATARELWEVVSRLHVLHSEQGLLLERRSVLLTGLRSTIPAAPAWEPRRVDLDGRGVRNLLLGLGAVLLGIAALVFTVVSWGRLGLPAKAMILTSLAGVALYLPWPLARRGLGATAEAVAAVGLLLAVLECYAAYSYGLFGAVDGRWYAAGASALLAGGAALYARFAPVRGARAAAVLAGQFPLPLTAFALHATPTEFAAALLATSALDLAALRLLADRAVRIAGSLTGLLGLLLATATGVMAFLDGGDKDLASCLRLAPVLLAAAVLAMGWARVITPDVSAAAGIALGLAVAFPAAAGVDAGWEAACLAGAAVLVVAAGRMAPVRFRTGLWTSGALMLAAPGLWALADTASVLGDRAGVDGQSVVVLALVAALLFAARQPLAGTATAALAVTSLPVLAGFALPASLVVQLALAAVLFALAVRAPDHTYVALAVSGVAVGWALDGQVATVVALSAVFLLCTALAVVSRTNTAAALSAVVVAGGLSGAVADLSGLATPAEVFTVPVTLGGLLLGLLWRGRPTSSWTVYGPALAITFVPSLLLVWDQAGWQRPLLLGTAALATTLAGLRFRRQAPALLGGVTLLLDAAHELAPHVAQLAGLLPRWVPIALAGLLLLALGATYEHRLRDVRRLHGRFASMH